MKKKRFVSLLLTLVMCLPMTPITAMADEPPEAAPNQYLSNIALNRANNDTNQLYLLSDALPYETFSFDPLQTEYNIMLVDVASRTDQTIQFIATLDESVEAELAGQFLTSSGTYINATGTYYTNNVKSAVGAAIQLNSKVKMDESCHTVHYVTGTVKSGMTEKAAGYENTDTYKFNFYRKATLKSFEAAYESGDKISVTPATFDPYETNLTLENVKPDTKILYITGPAMTLQSYTTLKFDNGSGQFTQGPTVDTFTLDLTNYGSDKYTQAGGSLIIPFKLDYAGNDDNSDSGGVDGYYTLTVSFEGTVPTDYTPVFTSDLVDATVNIGDSPSLTVEVEALESDTGAPLSYRWYSSASESKGDVIPDATGATYAPPTDSAGTTYYVCEVTRTVGGNKYFKETEPVKVTVEDEPTGGSALNGFVKNITFQATSDEYIIFNDFEQDRTYYEIELPDNFSGRGRLRVMVEPSDVTLRHSLSVESSDGDINRYRGNRQFSGDVFDVAYTGGGSIESGSGSTSTLYSILDYLEIDERNVFEINVHEVDKEEDGDVYVFVITYAPVVTGLSASAGDKSLSIIPQPGQSADEAAFNKDYHTTTNAAEIVLKGVLWQPISNPNYTYSFNGKDETEAIRKHLGTNPARFFYNGKDETEGFSTDGVKITLSEYAKDENNTYAIPFSIVYNAGAIKTQNDYTLHVHAVESVDWIITGQPQGGTYNKGDKVVLSVKTNAGEGNVTYQWQRSNSRSYVYNNTDIYDIPGATEASFEAPTDIGGVLGTRYYRCVVTDKKTAAYSYSDIAEVLVNIGKVNAPVIECQPGLYNFASSLNPASPYKTEYLQGEAIDPIQTVVNSIEGDSLNTPADPVRIKIEWFYNTEASEHGAVLLDGADNTNLHSVTSSLHYCIVTEPLAVGEHYFYCVATAVSNADETNTNSVTSDFVKISVSERTELVGLEGRGTESEPYLIKSVDELKKIDEYVLGGDFLAGAVFKFANDITLPADWEPIGKDNGGKGRNLLPFSGIIDGDNKTLTVSEGGKPLLEYTRDAVVRNLNIFGKEINGAGLLDKVSVDYGTDGIYQQYTDPDVITMENVTLLNGSKTLGSGLANGGFNSGINNIIVKNCIIQENVIVGYNKNQGDIGSFVGTLNGRIEDSVSYATVYGTSNVGGLVGRKGQSMGDCEVINSAFLGTIEATGGKVGGIIGAGYISESAPNTPPITVRNCYVVADITGNSTSSYLLSGYDRGGGIGGIAGSEIGLRGARNYSYISDNHFYGTITDTNSDAGTKYARVGGILGEIGRYDPLKLTYQNNYYLENSNYEGIGYQLYPHNDWEPNKNSFIAKSAGEFGDSTVAALLNAGEGSLRNWIQGSEGYPVHDPNAATVVYKLEIEGEYKSIYYLGESFNTDGMLFTAYLTDGTTRSLTPDQVSFEGFVSDTTGNPTVTAAYEGAKAFFTVSVIKQYDDATPENPGNTDNAGISVRFVLIGSTQSGGDIDLTNGDYKGAVYETWIPMRTYTMDKDATVLELFVRALGGLEFSIMSNDNYIDKIKNPGTGIWLSEFTNGPRSGWMYTVGKNANGSDGRHSRLGLREQVMSDGDVIIWHYVNDYAYEVKDWFPDSEYPSLATDDTYYNAWLSVLPNSGVTPPPAGGTSVGTPVTEIDIDETETPLAGGGSSAKAEVKSEDVKSAIDTAKEDGTAAVSVTVKGSADTKIADVTMPKASAKEIADNGLEFVVKSPVGDVSFGKDALNTIAAKPGDTLEVIIADEGKTETVTANNKTFTLTVKVGDAELTDLGGAVAVALPYTKAADEDAELLTVYKLEADGSYTEIKDAKYDTATGKAAFTTSETGSYFVSEWISPFTDISKNAWYYKAVRYAYANGLMNGTGDGDYSPQATLTRAMLITILAREAGIDTDGGDTWYSKAIEWGIANGITDGTNPDSEITREQFAAMLYRYADSPRTSGGFDAYDDAASVSSWAEDALAWAVGSGLITGRTETTLAPAGTATRAEAATLLQRYLEKAV